MENGESPISRMMSLDDDGVPYTIDIKAVGAEWVRDVPVLNKSGKWIEIQQPKQEHTAWVNLDHIIVIVIRT